MFYENKKIPTSILGSNIKNTNSRWYREREPEKKKKKNGVWVAMRCFTNSIGVFVHTQNSQTSLKFQTFRFLTLVLSYALHCPLTATGSVSLKVNPLQLHVWPHMLGLKEVWWFQSPLSVKYTYICCFFSFHFSKGKIQKYSLC